MGPFNDRCISPMEKEMLHHQFHMKEMRELDDFKKCITSICENYIKMIDTKISMQDTEIQKATIYMKEKIVEATGEYISKAIADGRINIDFSYDPETESLYIGGELIG